MIIEALYLYIMRTTSGWKPELQTKAIFGVSRASCPMIIEILPLYIMIITSGWKPVLQTKQQSWCISGILPYDN